MSDDKKEYGSAYGKRPLWQWVLLYVVLGGVAYGLIYYFFLSKNGASVYNQSGQYSAPQTTAPTAAPSGNIYLVKTDAVKGAYLTDFAGMTLYTFDRDTTGVSNCYDACAAKWPAYSSGATAQSTFPANISLITRTGGAKQFAWKGMPLYYYQLDTKVGDLKGDGVGGIWHIVKP